MGPGRELQGGSRGAVELRVGYPGRIAFGQVPVSDTRTVAGCILRHLKRNAIAQIEIVEVQNIAPDR